MQGFRPRCLNQIQERRSSSWANPGYLIQVWLRMVRHLMQNKVRLVGQFIIEKSDNLEDYVINSSENFCDSACKVLLLKRIPF